MKKSKTTRRNMLIWGSGYIRMRKPETFVKFYFAIATVLIRSKNARHQLADDRKDGDFDDTVWIAANNRKSQVFENGALQLYPMKTTYKREYKWFCEIILAIVFRERTSKFIEGDERLS